MIIDKIKKWIIIEKEWFIDFLTEMTINEDYGDDISGSYPDNIELENDKIYISYSTSNRCGDSDYYLATIPIADVIRKLRLEKLETIIKN